MQQLTRLSYKRYEFIIYAPPVAKFHILIRVCLYSTYLLGLDSRKSTGREHLQQAAPRVCWLLVNSSNLNPLFSSTLCFSCTASGSGGQSAPVARVDRSAGHRNPSGARTHGASRERRHRRQALFSLLPTTHTAFLLFSVTLFCSSFYSFFSLLLL